MIHEIEPNQYHVEYQNRKPDKESVILAFSSQKILVNVMDNHVKYPVFSEMGLEIDAVRYLFAVDETMFFLYIGDSEILADGYQYENISILRGTLPKMMDYAGVTAHQFYLWYRDHKFCGRCKNELKHDERERMLSCDQCGNTIYPKISPAVIVAITNGDKIVMTKYAGRAYSKYALVAGFSEVGETPEMTVEREVMEEVGLKVKNIRYYKSQPWSFSGTLLLGFFAELDGDQTITLDEEELSEAAWFQRDEIEVEPDDISLTNEMICLFKQGGL